MTVTLKEYAGNFRKKRSDIEARIKRACRDATLRAIETAAELTPPTTDDLSGTNTRSGGMKQHWATDSDPEPKVQGDEYTTTLGNNKVYASYVNDGHRMDKHFVPGLTINPYSGLLEFNPDGKGGIVVGTKTPYVPGIFMTDKAKETYKKVLRTELGDIGRILE